MSFATRLKKLTSIIYSPTKPSSEVAIRTQFDDSIQEVYDNVTTILTSTTQGASGAYNIGINALGVVASNIEDAMAEVQANVSDAASGTIVNGSITDEKMSPTGLIVKTNLITVAAPVDLADVGTNTTSIEANATAIDVLEDHHLYYTTTGTATAYVLTTTELFDFTKNGSLRVNPHLTNTASSTISVNGTTKNIRKYDISTDSYVILEAEDIKKNNQLELRFDVVNDFFVLAPKSGASLLVETESDTAHSGTATRVQADGVGTTILTVATLPSKCASVCFQDTTLDNISAPTTPTTILTLTKDTSVGVTITSSVSVYNKTGTKIGDVLTSTKSAGFTGVERTRIYSFSLYQVEINLIRVICNYSDNSNNVRMSYATFAGKLDEATIRAYSQISGSAVGTIDVTTTINGDWNMYTV